jgi:hypothetical protein
VSINALTPTADVVTELLVLFPDAALSGWEVESTVAADFVLDLEECRYSILAAHAHLRLEPRVSVRILAALEFVVEPGGSSVP